MSIPGKVILGGLGLGSALLLTSAARKGMEAIFSNHPTKLKGLLLVNAASDIAVAVLAISMATIVYRKY